MLIDNVAQFKPNVTQLIHKTHILKYWSEPILIHWCEPYHGVNPSLTVPKIRTLCWREPYLGVNPITWGELKTMGYLRIVPKVSQCRKL